MAIREDSFDGKDSCTCILVTGANSGIGFATCCRLIDEFLQLRPLSESLRLIITTRSVEKSNDAVTRLGKYLHRNAPHSKDRISFQAEQVDLTILHSVCDVSQRLLASVPKLDALILNAGISDYIGMNWPQALWLTTVDLIYSVTYPSFNKGSLGVTTKPQLPPSGSGIQEPPLGQVFCANVFGHYILTHALTPLLSPSSRIIWLSSLSADASALDPVDIQCLSRPYAYHSSKRLTDILALTASLPSTRPFVERFFSTGSTFPKPAISPLPRFYVSHPGIANTNVVPIHPLLIYLKLVSFYLARWFGSPWHTISTYTGACAPVWLALSPLSQLTSLEQIHGRGKWGSSTNISGKERVRRTEVEGWGYGGRVGDVQVFGTRGRKRDVVDLTEEERVRFEELGRGCWGEMERLRVEWEGRLEGEMKRKFGL